MVRESNANGQQEIEMIHMKYTIIMLILGILLFGCVSGPSSENIPPVPASNNGNSRISLEPTNISFPTIPVTYINYTFVESCFDPSNGKLLTTKTTNYTNCKLELKSFMNGRHVQDNYLCNNTQVAVVSQPTKSFYDDEIIVNNTYYRARCLKIWE